MDEQAVLLNWKIGRYLSTYSKYLLSMGLTTDRLTECHIHTSLYKLKYIVIQKRDSLTRAPLDLSI